MATIRFGRKQLRRRALWFMLASTTVLVGGLSIVSVLVIRRNLGEQLEKRGRALSHAAVLSSRLAFWTRDKTRAAEVVRPLFESDPDITYIYLLAPDETVLASAARGALADVPPHELSEAHRTGGSALRLKDIGGRQTGRLLAFSETLYEQGLSRERHPAPEERSDEEEDAGAGADAGTGVGAGAGADGGAGPDAGANSDSGAGTGTDAGADAIADAGARAAAEISPQPLRAPRLHLGPRELRAAADDESRLLAEETAPVGETTPEATARESRDSARPLAPSARRVEVGARVDAVRRVRRDTTPVSTVTPGARPLGSILLGLSPKAVEGEVRTIILVTLAIAVVVIVLFLLVIQLASRGAFRRIVEMMNIAGGLARGDLTQRVGIAEGDELGVLGQALNGIGSSLSQMMGQTVDAIERLRGAIQVLGELATSVADGARKQFQAVECTGAGVEGIARKTHDIADSVDALNEQTHRSSASILEIVENNRAVVENLSVMNANVDETTASIEEMSRSIGEVAQSVEELHQQAERTSTAMTQMDAAIREVEGNGKATLDLAERTSKDAVQGSESVSRLLEGMRRIAVANDEVGKSMVGLSERLAAVGRIVGVIDDIAEQTNLLALNAAIIAAQAGPHGRGFAVVADEIKQLADKVGVSTREIRDLIAATETEAQGTNHAVAASVKAVGDGTRLSSVAEAALKKILESADRSNAMMRTIARATEEQAKGSEEVTRAAERVAATVQQIALATSEQAKGGELIARSAEKMREATQSVDRSTREQAEGSSQVSRSLEQIAAMAQRLSAAQAAQSKESEAALVAVSEVRRIAELHVKSVDQIRAALDTVESAVEQLRAEIARFQV